MMTRCYIIGLFCLACLSVSGMAGDVELRYTSLLDPVPPVSGELMADGDQSRPTSLDMSELETSDRKNISMKKALLLSILLPGAGQYYADARFKGQVFMGVEAAIWSAFFAYRVYGGWKKDDYRDYAAAYAGVDHTDKSDEFYDWLGFYDSREEFNQFGRLYYPERAYLPDNESFNWQWQSEEHREQYKELKDDAEIAFRNSTFLIGLAVANRVIAGIDTYRTVKAAQAKLKSLTQIGDYRFTFKPDLWGDDPGFTVKVSKKF